MVENRAMFSEALFASGRTLDLYTGSMEEGEILPKPQKRNSLVFRIQTTKDQARILLSVPSLSSQMLAFEFERWLSV